MPRDLVGRWPSGDVADRLVVEDLPVQHVPGAERQCRLGRRPEEAHRPGGTVAVQRPPELSDVHVGRVAESLARVTVRFGRVLCDERQNLPEPFGDGPGVVLAGQRRDRLPGRQRNEVTVRLRDHLRDDARGTGHRVGHEVHLRRAQHRDVAVDRLAGLPDPRLSGGEPAPHRRELVVGGHRRRVVGAEDAPVALPVLENELRAGAVVLAEEVPRQLPEGGHLPFVLVVREPVPEVEVVTADGRGGDEDERVERPVEQLPDVGRPYQLDRFLGVGPLAVEGVLRGHRLEPDLQHVRARVAGLGRPLVQVVPVGEAVGPGCVCDADGVRRRPAIG